MAEWRERLGDECDLAKPLLKSTGKKSRSYPCPSPGGSGCPREVVEHPDGSIVAVCGDQEERNCNDVPLLPDDIIVYSLDRQKLAGWVSQVLGIKLSFTSVDGTVETWHIGEYVPFAGKRFPVFLLLAYQEMQRSEAVQRICHASAVPFMLVVSSEKTLSAHMRDLIRAHHGRLIPLGDLLVDGGKGQISVSTHAKAIVEEFHADNFPVTEDNTSSPRFPTPPDATWSDFRMLFPDNHKVTVFCRDLEKTYNFTQMGMTNSKNAEPTVQWKLLVEFADGHGTVEVTTKKEISRISTRKKRLNQQLSEFFGIEDEAILWDPSHRVYSIRFPIEHA